MMSAMDEPIPTGSLLDSLLSEEIFRPQEPQTLEEAGLPPTVVEGLLCKQLLACGMSSGRGLAQAICLPFGLVDPILQNLRTRQIIVHTGSAHLNDYTYALTDAGRQRAQTEMEICGYVGAAPVPLDDYIVSVDAQSIRAESPRQEDLLRAFEGLTLNDDTVSAIGPAVNSGAGLFLYGEPGNGKTTLARRITGCFGQHIWIPRTLIVDGQFIKLFDATYHRELQEERHTLLKDQDHDPRWVKIRRPTVVVGGELTMESLEIRHDPHHNVSEAPVQLKSNCGCLLIDDFGRQRVDPDELLNRWIVPLESGHDFLTLATGKKIQVPFDQLIIFSTNLDPVTLADDAFLRRIPYKIEIGDPSEEEYRQLFQMAAEMFDCPYEDDAVTYLLQTHLYGKNRPLRRCHARDILSQIRNYCAYHDLPLEMKPEYFDHVVKSYFTALSSSPSKTPDTPAPRHAPNVTSEQRPSPQLDQGANGARAPSVAPAPVQEAGCEAFDRTMAMDR